MQEYLIRCKHCGQPLTVDDGYANQVVDCPDCREKMLIPPAMKAAKMSNEIPEVMHQLTQDEQGALQQFDPAYLQMMGQATNKSCWEFVLMSTVITQSLGQMNQLFASGTIQPQTAGGMFKKSGNYSIFISQSGEALFQIQANLYHLFNHQFETALYSDSVLAIFEFANQLFGALGELHSLTQALYAEPIANEQIYLTNFNVISNAIQFMVASMGQFAQELGLVADERGAHLGRVESQLTLMHHEFFIYFINKEKMPRKAIR
jgi:DNA-directed RNA polymerase subunit RPC12/RpoP